MRLFLIVTISWRISIQRIEPLASIAESTKMTSWLTLDVGTYLNYGKGTTQSFNLFSPGYTYMPYNGLVNGDGTYYTNTEEERYSCTI